MRPFKWGAGGGEWVHRAVTKGQGFPPATFIGDKKKLEPKELPSWTIEQFQYNKIQTWLRGLRE